MKKSILLFATLLLSQFIFAQVPDSFFSKADAFFKKNVSKGLVNYTAIKANPGELNALLKIAETASVSKSRPNEFKAFYINAYNLSVIQKISEKYPINNPLKVNGLFDKKQLTIAGKKTTLNGIENKILRATYPKEARFHFVLVCAGLGCPPIGKKVKISQIFEWYAQDFKQFGSYVDFLNKYRKTPLEAKSKVSFYPYNWKLNDLK